MAREFLNRRSCRKRFGVWTEAVRVTVERRREGMATETFEENFLHRRKKVTIRLTQLPHRPAGMHKRGRPRGAGEPAPTSLLPLGLLARLRVRYRRQIRGCGVQ